MYTNFVLQVSYYLCILLWLFFCVLFECLVAGYVPADVQRSKLLISVELDVKDIIKRSFIIQGTESTSTTTPFNINSKSKENTVECKGKGKVE